MKNFVRLVRFAWPRRYRFGPSVGGEADGRVLISQSSGQYCPLKILFNNENPQIWISSKIDSIEETIVVLEAQAGEVRTIKAVADSGLVNRASLRSTIAPLIKKRMPSGKNFENTSGSSIFQTSSDSPSRTSSAIHRRWRPQTAAAHC